MTSNTSSRSLISAGLQRARREILLFTALVLGGCGTTIPSPTVSEIHHAPLAAVLADEHISNEEWRNEIGPIAAVLPLRASPFARTLLSVLANTEVGLDSSAELGIRSWLGDCGYIVEGQRSAISPVIIASRNPSELDTMYEGLHTLAAGQNEIRVAVLEAGAQQNHPAFATQVLRISTWDFSLDKPSLVPDKHGTGVASVAAAGTHRIRLVLTGSGRNKGISTWTDAISHAATSGAKVINLSYDFYGSFNELRQAIRQHPDVLFVVSADNAREVHGEGSRSVGQYSGAIREPNLLIVTGVDGSGQLAGAEGREFVTHAAPSQYFVTASANGYTLSTGTSFSAAYVSNISSKVLTLAPWLSPSEVSKLLALTSVPSQQLATKVRSGGVVTAKKAVQLAALLGSYRNGLAPNLEETAKKLGLCTNNCSLWLSLALHFSK